MPASAATRPGADFDPVATLENCVRNTDCETMTGIRWVLDHLRSPSTRDARIVDHLALALKRCLDANTPATRRAANRAARAALALAGK